MALGILVLLFVELLAFILVPALSANLVRQACSGGDCADDSAIAIATQLGRLDIVSLVLGVLGIGIGAFAIFGFFAIKDHSEAVAQNIATQVAETIAEKVAKQRIDWLYSNLRLEIGAARVEEIKERIEQSEEVTDVD